MAIRILFVPFPLPKDYNAPGADYIDKNNAWIQNYKKKAVQEDKAVHDIYQLFFHDKPSPMILGLGEDDQIYIRGHSLPGFNGIFDHTEYDENGKRIPTARMDQDLLIKLTPNRDTGHKNPKYSIKAEVVVDRLIKSGLQSRFKGAIKCYNCHSAEADVVGTSFAKAMRDALNDRQYKACRVYGYKGALSSWQDFETGHKSSTAGGRASSQRVLIE